MLSNGAPKFTNERDIPRMLKISLVEPMVLIAQASQSSAEGSAHEDPNGQHSHRDAKLTARSNKFRISQDMREAEPKHEDNHAMEDHEVNDHAIDHHYVNQRHRGEADRAEAERGLSRYAGMTVEKQNRTQ